MVITCIVKGCDNKEKVYSAVMFHRVPTHHIQRRAWLAAVNKNPKTPLMTLKKWRVCSEHFTPEDYTCTGTRLKDEATPTIFKSLTQQRGSSPNAVSVLLHGIWLSCYCYGIPPYNIVIHFTRLEKRNVLFCVTVLGRVTLLE
ncbi:THAP domain-containing protein 1 [Anabarilius grahami]|uniref:THAP domain-containing protein 1 n=1 Tax=Anabarilius grahami TaxID=495550 RepID=A0A3N0XWG5_ANAGA|nr:THAP domain-containing protein 1 [Anabarilius grahami]